MSKQTINIGASPNDGTGTPLRTSFDYCNQNFTELYTATGPSGNNIVVPGNATITGDLTVDTSTLKVDSANDRVGIGTATPGGALEVFKNTNGQNRLFLNNPSTGTGAYDAIDFTAGTANNQILSMGSGYSGSFPYLTGALLLRSAQANGIVLNTAGSAAAIQFGINDTLAMTLNSTGLGVGVVPSAARLEVGGQDGTQFYIRSTGTTPSKIRGFTNAAEAGVIGFLNGGGIYFDISGERMRIDSSGNVGIGVTPSAWGGSYKSVQVNEAGGFAGKNDGLIVAQNCYFDGTNWVNNRASTFSSRYDMNVAGNGIHAWYVYNASFGTVGNTIPFTQAMTLDASGYLLLGTTDTTFTSGAGYKFGPGATPSNGQVGASSSNGDLTLRVYSTGAAAYRFYVGFGGTVFATSATISAISDARLKENVQNLDVGLNEILALKPRKFDWKAGKGKDIKGDRGFIAQEFETVFPNLIDEWADPAPEGEAPYKSVRQDLIPVLVKAIQELTARVQTLETR